jgi:hypothetical protein
MGQEITVVDDSDYVGYAASMVREGEIYMTDVTSMVANVLAALRKHYRNCAPGRAEYNTMSRLNILDHGNKNVIEIGTDRIEASNVSSFEPALKKLRGRFDKGGFVHLQHCEIGQNRALLTALARIFGVSVYAGASYQNPVYRFNFGDYVRADPNGTFTQDVGRP